MPAIGVCPTPCHSKSYFTFPYRSSETEFVNKASNNAAQDVMPRNDIYNSEEIDSSTHYDHITIWDHRETPPKRARRPA